MVQWVNAEERLPKNQTRTAGNKYHMIKYQYVMDEDEIYDYKIENGYDEFDEIPEFESYTDKAMYMNGEWWVSYHAKLMYPVQFWLEDDDWLI